MTLEPDQLELVRLGGELFGGLLVGHDPPGEPLALLDDLAHPALDRLQVLRGERRLDVEVVVEPVLHGRADTQLGLREQLLHGLRHDVRGGMPHDVPAVVAGVIHRLDEVAVGDLVSQVAQFAVDPGGDDAGRQGGTGSFGGKGRARRRASLDHMLATCEGDTKLLAGHGVLLDGRIDYRKNRLPDAIGTQPYRAREYSRGTKASGGRDDHRGSSVSSGPARPGAARPPARRPGAASPLRSSPGPRELGRPLEPAPVRLDRLEGFLGRSRPPA